MSRFGGQAGCGVARAPWFVRCRGFTLIEMLTVIAIIGILAAILLPVIRAAQKRAGITVVKADVASLREAISQYVFAFGALPPDHNDDKPLHPSEPNADLDDLERDEQDFEHMDTPNECLVWFLTREYLTNENGAGRPWATGSGWTPATSASVFSRTALKPVFDPKGKQTRDYDGDGFPEFVDRWGRPYMYRAYPHWYPRVSPWLQNSDFSTPSSGILRIQLSDPSSVVGAADGAPDYGNLNDVMGKIELRGFDNNRLNGVFKFEGSGANTVDIEFRGSVPGTGGTTRQFSFPLRDRQTGDVYSLGPNGMTRAMQRPVGIDGRVAEWKPMQSGQYELWKQIWGTPGDGNDTLSGNNNMVPRDKDKDDIAGW